MSLRIQKLLKFIKKHSVFFIFLVFGCLVFFQHLFMDMYFDDYGYASLSYANPNFNPSSQSFGFSDIVKYLAYHYNHWGGRIVYFFIEIILLRAGIRVFAALQSILIVGIFYLIYKIIKQSSRSTRYDWLIALTSAASYGTIGILTFRDAIFWATASALYIFPVFFLLLFVYLFKKYSISNPPRAYLYVVMPVLAFMASFSQEQIGMGMLFFLSTSIAIELLRHKQKPKLWALISLGFSAIGLTLLLLAPGNIQRATTSSAWYYNRGITEKILISSKNIVMSFFGQDNVIFISLLLIFGLWLSSSLWKAKQTYINFSAKCLFIITGLVVTLSIQRSLPNFINNRYAYYGLIILIFSLVLILCYYLLQKNKKYQLIALLFAGLSSQAVMLVAPYYPLRSSVFFIITLYVVFLSIVFSSVKIKSTHLFLFFLPIMIFAFYNYTTITLGYYKNSPVNNYNRGILLAAKNSIKMGKNIEVVKLKKLPNSLYSQTMPYQDDYTLGLLKNYYSLPSSIKIIYE